MEPFRLDRQSKSFLAVLLIVALALIPLAPFASLAFGALSLSAGMFAIAGAPVIAYATIMLGTGNARLLSHAMRGEIGV
jgi:hypothetical protein